MKKISTKEKILFAARALFIEHGFAGTAMNKIAQLAEVNHSLIFHHFGNKEKLWREVKHNIAKDSQQQSKMLPDIKPKFKDFMRELFTKSIHFYQSNPDIVRMINWQRLEYNNDPKIGVTLSPEFQAWISAFKHYQQKGDINAELKTEFIITLILSIISSAALDPNIFIAQNKDKQAYIDFCVERLIIALTNQSSLK